MTSFTVVLGSLVWTKKVVWGPVTVADTVLIVGSVKSEFNGLDGLV